MVSVALFAADEDGALVRLHLRESGVETSGAYVMEVQSGAVDLAEFLGRSSPDVVIYDHVEPAVRNGRWLAELQRVCETLRIPCVLSVGDVNDLQHTAVNWAACILIRPYDEEMARLAIREALKDAPDEHRADRDERDPGEAAA